MFYFSRSEINEIIDALENMHLFFIAKNINPNFISSDKIKQLIKLGFNKNDFVSYPQLAFQFGLLSKYLNDSEIRNFTFRQLKQAILAKKFLPLSAEEKSAISFLEERAYNDIKGLGNRISSSLRTTMIEADLRQRHNYEKVIKNAAIKTIKRRESVKFFRSEVGNKLGDWSRDLDRIGDYILHEAFENGRASAIKKQYGKDALVYFKVHKDACDSCHRLYIKNKKTGEPKIFKLSYILSNGTNIGRKQKDWKTTLPPLHPYCRCDIEPVLPKFIWSDKTKRFIPNKNVKENKYNFRGLVTINKNK